MDALDMDALAVRLYRGYDMATDDYEVLYRNIDMPRAQEAIMYALEHRGADPPLEALRTLWALHGIEHPYAFFVDAVFQHATFWAEIIQCLVAEGRWDAISSVRAMQWHADGGHMLCSRLYVQGLFTHTDIAIRMVVLYAKPEQMEEQHMRHLVQHMSATVLHWFGRLQAEQLIHIADDLLQMDEVDHLLEIIAGHEGFKSAVQRNPTARSKVARLGMRVQDLTDDHFVEMVRTYMLKRGRLGLGLCLHWNTDAMRRGMENTCTLGFGPPPNPPADVHELLYAEGNGGSPYLVAKTLREEPVACRGRVGDTMREHWRAHRARQEARICSGVGAWALPEDIMRAIAAFT